MHGISKTFWKPYFTVSDPSSSVSDDPLRGNGRRKPITSNRITTTFESLSKPQVVKVMSIKIGINGFGRIGR
jgi:hypothetical protein